ncbi:WD repeat-containing protein 20 [Lucilia sericata]|uniref:WD repeat-containing protein 20 n=1 Tax=Lucilia sericata TaxID=13632 RepID=UPI0018A82B70|nr:WD repeat-containing protein 20 [Lucilia sericata]
MATQLDPNVKDDLKTQFVTREGTYRLLTLSEYSRPNRVGYTNNQSSPQVRVSIVTLPNPPTATGNNSSSNSGTNNSSATNGSNGAGSSSHSRPLTNGNNSQNASNGAGGDGGGAGYDVQSSSSLNGQQSQYVVPSSMDARLGAGMSMHTMMNGSGVGGLDQNGLSASQVLGGDRICFNFGRELYVYAFRGVKKGAELSKPIDKKFYKGTNPSCHDFNATTATPTGAPLLVGFTTGQIQLVSPQPGPREYRKLYNEDRLIDKTKVTCLKWLPNSPNLFLASHASGHLYLYNENLQCPPTAPNYQPFKMGEGYSILTCKSKSSRNPLYKWVFNTENCCINEFCFSPCGSNLAIVSQDGFLRVFHYDTMELLGIARSYFGGFLCVCWSPDGKYIVVGGEDDLVTVWSFHERRVVARGQGHRSWVSVVAFDPYTTSYTSWDGGDFSDDENQIMEYGASRYGGDGTTANGFDSYAVSGHDKNSTPIHSRQRPQSASFRSEASSLAPDKLAISYRLGSVSQDTQICLWDITEDILRHPLSLRQRVNSCNMNDTSFMNGGIDADGVKVIRPVAIGHPNNNANSFSQHCSSPTKEMTTATTTPQTSGEQNSNSSSSKFSTANCTISSQSSNANTPPDDLLAATATTANKTNSKSLANASTTGGTIKFPNCITATKSDSIDGNTTANHVNTFSTSSGYNSKTSNSSKSSDSGISAFNSLTQRLSNFSFLNSSDKKSLNLEGGSTRQNRRTLSLLKSYNHHNSTMNHQHMANSTQIETNANSSTSSHSFGSLKLGKSSSQHHHHHQSLINNLSNCSPSSTTNSIIPSYDPLKLIGTSACPRFDECPLLEPLVCKKIAHERLSALIFREDCFLTACQDGFIYTWARPGYATNVPQHLSPTQTAPPGGTVI